MSTVLPAATFDIPGVPGQTTWFDQYEDTQDVAVTVSPSVQQPVTGIVDFRRTDVVFNWAHHFTFTAPNWTAGTGQTLTNSAYAPYNIVGPTRLKIQNQYNSVEVESGIDWYIFNLIRPYRRSAHQRGILQGANPEGSPAGNNGVGYLNVATPQPNLVVPAQWSRATAFDLFLGVPGGAWFDEYYALDVSGNYLGALADVFVSPQYMAGTQRLLKTSILMNPLLGPTTDTAPVQTTTNTPTTDTASTASITATLSIRRVGVYGTTAAASLPAPQPWQYRWKTDRFSLSGKSQAIIQVPDDAGQVLCTYLRIFDPAANGGVGAPVELSAFAANSLAVQFLYGSGQTWFQGTAEECQLLWLEQHGFLLPQGVVAIDFATDELDTFTNKRAMNTLNTAGIEWSVQFAAPLSSEAYAVLGVESLVYVV